MNFGLRKDISITRGVDRLDKFYNDYLSLLFKMCPTPLTTRPEYNGAV